MRHGRLLGPRANRAVVVGRVASERLGRARVGTGLAFGLVGFVYFTWAARLPAIKADLGLSNGQLAVALVGLEAGALAGLQLGGVLVPRTGSRAALAVALPALAVLLAGPGLAFLSSWCLSGGGS